MPLKSPVAISALLLVTAASHAETQWALSSGIDYSSGKYGASGRTETLSVPFSLKYEHADWTIKGSIPYIETTGPSDVVGQGTDRILLGPERAGRTRVSGLGDFVATVNWTAYQQDKWLIELGSKIKFATADAGAGLGTGKNDYSLQTEIYRSFDSNTLFTTLGYKKMGSPDGMSLKDPFYASVGWSLRTSGQTSLGINYDYRQKIQDSGDPIREASLFMTHKLNANWKIQTYVVGGFSKASPDLGAGLFIFSSI